MKHAKTLVATLFLLIVCSLFGQTATAQVRIQFNSLPEPLEQVMNTAAAGDVKEAEKQLKSLRSTLGDTADYYYVKGSLAPFKLAEASAIRAPFIARGMRKDWEKAVELDPDHELANFSLAMFYAAAPGLFGGDPEKANAILAHLQQLGSDWQYPLKANLLMAQEADVNEVKNAYLEWVAFAPKDIPPRFTIAAYLNNEGAYEEAAHQLAQLDTLIAHQLNEARVAEDEALIQDLTEEQHKADYQWGKLAAESGTYLEEGKRRLQAMVAAGESPKNINLGFVHARLAMVFRHLGDDAAVQMHRSAAEQFMSGDRNLDSLIARIDES